ncbi:hypothetical protein T265_08139 [Opisthorchis viverrini]|uniref:Uncharacterized protein n=1 Tax=Opisthorchis viverrini TaxID=6198 RepID=A0A075A9J4_OPIVI|nr:hypothetical protein T265_08139 [Opisthorchis viverrini]KER24154.1 hypothetical protein T265_08139 [Opisthorchis viverrini]
MLHSFYLRREPNCVKHSVSSFLSTRHQVNMSSPRTKSEEYLEKVSVPDGTEKVINIKKVQQSASIQLSKTTPLSVHTGYASNMRTSELHVEEMKSQVRRRSKSSGQKKSGRDHSRRSQLIVRTGDGASGSRRRVVSCVDLTAPEPAETHLVHAITGEEESTLTGGTHRAAKSIRKIRGRHRDEWLSSKAEEVPQSGWRYSGIFAPDTGRHRPSSRTKHSRNSRAQISAQASPTPAAWSPMNYMSPACPRCSSLNVNQERTNPYPIPVMNGIYLPYAPYSVENFPSQMRSGSVQQHHHHSHVRHQQQEQFYESPLQHSPQFHHHHHHHHRPQHSPPYPSPYGTKYMPIPQGRPVGFSPNVEDLRHAEVNGTDRTVDLMEIEYAADSAGEKDTYLSSDALNLIVKLAKSFNKSTQRLEEIAKQLKLALDARLGEKWHVVIGDDSFGSNLASLPGALANFKLGRNVFLVWQT